MNKILKAIVFFFLILFIFGCKKQKKEGVVSNELETIKGEFILNFRNKEPVVFLNPECEFDNRKTQAQYNYISGGSSGPDLGFVLKSNYENIEENDSTLNQIWITLLNIYKEGQKQFDLEILEEVLKTEKSNLETKNLLPQIQIEICGIRYNNGIIDTIPNTPHYLLNESFKYKINDYDVLYKSGCIEKKLLYFELVFEGMFYRHDLFNKLDSVYIEESEMELLFDLD